MKTLLISRIPQIPFLLAGKHTGIGVWYTKLAVGVGGRMRVWIWRVATGRSFCLPAMMGCVSICGIAFGGGLELPTVVVLVLPRLHQVPQYHTSSFCDMGGCRRHAPNVCCELG